MPASHASRPAPTPCPADSRTRGTGTGCPAAAPRPAGQQRAPPDISFNDTLDTVFCTLLHCILASLADLPHQFLCPGRPALGKGDAPDIVGSDLQPAVKGEEGDGGGEEGPVALPAAHQPVTVAAALCLDSRIVLHLLPHLHPASRVCVCYL